MTTLALLLSWTTTPDMAGVTEPPTKSPFVATICSAAAGHPSTIQTLKPLQKIADLVTITGLCEKNYLARATLERCDTVVWLIYRAVMTCISCLDPVR